MSDGEGWVGCVADFRLPGDFIKNQHWTAFNLKRIRPCFANGFVNAAVMEIIVYVSLRV